AFPALSSQDINLVTNRPTMQTNQPSGRIVFRLATDTNLQIGLSGLEIAPAAKSAAQGASSQLRLQDLVAQTAGSGQITARVPSAVRDRRKYDSLARYGQFETNRTDRNALAKIAANLLADPAIDMVWLEPVAIPAVLDFGQPTPKMALAPTDTASGSFEGQQGYLGDAPTGIGALSMRAQAGALGAGVNVIDVEGGWLWSHEDFPTPLVEIGTQIPTLSWRNHGTAVLGVIRGQDNGIGVTGIAPACEIGSSSIGDQSTAEAILSASTFLSPGDVIVIELHAPGPEATDIGQQGFVPMEFWQDNFDAIQAVTRQGIMVLEAAGNGEVDLDAAIYAGMFDPALRHSGAIMIGATNGSALDPAWFTNHGLRVDLNGWGFNVTTMAYGDLQGDPTFPEEQWYTTQFNGTSSATPVVTGAVVSLTGMVRARHGFSLDAQLARDILLATGTPANGPEMIGSRPDLVAAYALADTSIGEVTGVVTDLNTGLPIEGVLVQVSGGGSSALTAADGSWRIPLMVGPVSFEFSDFLYQDGNANTAVTLSTSTVLNIALDPWPLVAIKGVVYGNGAALPFAHIEPLLLPIAADIGLADGSFSLEDIPVGNDEQILVDGVPGFGARFMDVTTMGATGDVFIYPVLNPIDEDFSLSDGGFVSSQGLWTHGAPVVSGNPGSVAGSFTGANCWGIGMDGFGYADDVADTLTSSVYDLSAVTGPYFMSFHYFSDTEGSFDGANVQVSVGGGPFNVLAPIENYPDQSLGGLVQEPGWSGPSNRWTGTVFDVSAMTGGDFQIRFHFGSDAGVTAPGFFIDGITFGAPIVPSAVDDLVPSPVTAQLAAWPNPFNPMVNISFELPQAGQLEVAIFDVRGHRVKQLHKAAVTNTRGILQWSGENESGRQVASGVYLVRLLGPQGQSASQRVVLTK
ncbi:MAG: hypothetical protein ACI8S7_000931, partial [Candidatus Krumholzibacteriia bacterium]